jgi:hypothetical protein
MSKVKKSELKEIIKPIVEECISESIHKIILESGVLSSVISEVVRGLDDKPVLSEATKEKKVSSRKTEEDVSKKINETKERLMTAIGKNSYGGVNIFEGTTPAPEQSAPGKGPLADTDPNNPGVDISSIMNPAWGKLI